MWPFLDMMIMRLCFPKLTASLAIYCIYFQNGQLKDLDKKKRVFLLDVSEKMDSTNVVMACSGEGTFFVLCCPKNVTQISLVINVECPTTMDGHWYHMFHMRSVSAANSPYLGMKHSQCFFHVDWRHMRQSETPLSIIDENLAASLPGKELWWVGFDISISGSAWLVTGATDGSGQEWGDSRQEQVRKDCLIGGSEESEECENILLIGEGVFKFPWNVHGGSSYGSRHSWPELWLGQNTKTEFGVCLWPLMDLSWHTTATLRDEVRSYDSLDWSWGPQDIVYIIFDWPFCSRLIRNARRASTWCS